MEISEMPEGFVFGRQCRVIDPENASYPASAMRQLYLDCARQIVCKDDISFHVLLMEGVSSHFIHSVGRDEAFGIDLSDYVGVEVFDDDCVAVVGPAMVERDWGEKEMLEVVISDAALHIARVKQLGYSPRFVGGREIAWAATASTLAAAHDAIHLDVRSGLLNREIAVAAMRGVMRRYSIQHGAENEMRREMEIVSAICSRALATRGAYLPLPARIDVIAETAKLLALDTADTFVSGSQGGFTDDVRGL